MFYTADGKIKYDGNYGVSDLPGIRSHPVVFSMNRSAVQFLLELNGLPHGLWIDVVILSGSANAALSEIEAPNEEAAKAKVEAALAFYVDARRARRAQPRATRRRTAGISARPRRGIDGPRRSG